MDGFEDDRHGIGRGGREADGAEGFQIVDIIADVGDLIERKPILLCQRGKHRELVVNPLVHFGDRQLLPPALDDSGLLPGDERRDQPGRLEHLDPHAVAGVELLQLIARFRIIHAGIGQDPVHIHGHQAHAPQPGLQSLAELLGRLRFTSWH